MFILRKLFEKYETPAKVLMAYNMGEGGASRLWKQGIFEINYSKSVLQIQQEMNAELEEKVRAKYALLTDEEILDLLVNRKWYATIFEGIKALYATTSHQMTNRIVELVERYEDTLPELSAAVAEYEAKVKDHLKRMGFVW